MTEADREIIEIAKELFRSKKGEFIDPDDLLREQIVKWSIYMAIFCVITLVPAKIFGSSGGEHITGVLQGVIGVAFTLFKFYIVCSYLVIVNGEFMVSLWFAG
jgi:hypothetical protein